VTPCGGWYLGKQAAAAFIPLMKEYFSFELVYLDVSLALRRHRYEFSCLFDQRTVFNRTGDAIALIGIPGI
jgi:hypothetical protein